MSAPPGWHPQPDGRERWWDGQQWTEHFRDPEAAGATQQFDAVDPGYGGHPQQGDYAQQGGYPQQGGYRQQGYAPPPGGQYPPQKSGMSGVLKGCLITLGVLILLAIIAVVVAVFVFGSKVKTAVDDVQKSIDSQGTGQVVVVQVGQGFDAGAATVQDGWSVGGSNGIGQQVQGMKATSGTDSGGPTFFTMTFTGEDGNDVDTLCTVVPASSGGPSDVTCVPLFDQVDPSGDVTVTPGVSP